MSSVAADHLYITKWDQHLYFLLHFEALLVFCLWCLPTNLPGFFFGTCFSFFLVKTLFAVGFLQPLVQRADFFLKQGLFVFFCVCCRR